MGSFFFVNYPFNTNSFGLLKNYYVYCARLTGTLYVSLDKMSL